MVSDGAGSHGWCSCATKTSTPARRPPLPSPPRSPSTPRAVRRAAHR